MVKRKDAEAELQLPPGFRFFPTDEELVVHYLCKKTSLQSLPVPIIAEVDLYKYDPWQLPDKALFGEKEWYFFTPRDRKYPNGSRPNRAAGSGYWKATGADKPITAKTGKKRVGIKKALVFYAGKAPRGTKTNWIMHEYRLAEANRPTRKKGSLRLDDWVLCRIYNKKNSAEKVAVEQQENNPQQPTSASVDDSIIHEHVKTSLSDPSKMEIEIPKIAASSPLMNMNLSINPESTVPTFSNNFRKLPPIQAMEGFCSQQWENYAPRPHSDSSSSKPSSPDFVSEREEVQSNFKWTNLHQQDQPHHQHNNQTQQTLFPFGIEGLSNPLLPLEGFSMPTDCCQEYMNNFTTSSDCLSKFYSNDVLFQ